MANRSSMGGISIPVHSGMGSQIFGLDRAVIPKDLLAIFDKMVTLEDSLTEINRMISEFHMGDELPPAENPAGEGLKDARIKREGDVQLQALFVPSQKPFSNHVQASSNLTLCSIENTSRRKVNAAALTTTVFAKIRPLVNAYTGLEIPEFPLEFLDLKTLSCKWAPCSQCPVTGRHANCCSIGCEAYSHRAGDSLSSGGRHRRASREGSRGDILPVITVFFGHKTD
jgi:hypothetical protein